MTCFHCGKGLDTDRRPGRHLRCPKCGSDVKVCLNCKFYEPGSYNDCRESRAERVVDKAKANFCEFFEFNDIDKGAGGGGVDDDGGSEGDGGKNENALKKLKDLFPDD